MLPFELSRESITALDGDLEFGNEYAHFHARDPETGANRMNDTELYRQAFNLIRQSGCAVAP